MHLAEQPNSKFKILANTIDTIKCLWSSVKGALFLEEMTEYGPQAAN